MRIVAVFALFLAACGPFAVEQPDVPADTEHEAVPAKKKKNPVDAPNIVAPAPTNTSDTTMPLPSTVTELAQFPGAQLFKPTQTPAPGLVVLHGEEGGDDPTYRAFARDMAARGFVVIAMCWSGCTGRPATNEQVPVESIADVGRFLKASPDTNGTVSVFGWGRGAEAALVITAKANLDPFSAAAIYGGTDVVVAPWTWKSMLIANGVRIPVETYRGPMLVMHGYDDAVWSYQRAANIIEARDESNGTLVTQSEFFPHEGHAMSVPADQTQLRDRVAEFLSQPPASPPEP